MMPKSMDTEAGETEVLPAACVQLKELVEQVADVQCSLDKCSREKMSVTAELELARSQLNSVDVDYSKVITFHVAAGDILCSVGVHYVFHHYKPSL